MIKIVSCITGQHDILLVLLAVTVCAFGSFTALCLLARARDEMTGALHWRWLAAAAVVAGAAVWSTHFVTMLAYDSPLPLRYDADLTALSMVIAMVVAFGGFATLLYFNKPALGGAIFGGAIASMHFTGMAAVIVPATLVWAPIYVTASLAVGAAFGAAALSVFARAGGWRSLVYGTGLMFLAIAGLHFTAMTALTVTPEPVLVLPPQSNLPAAWLAIAIAAVMAMVVVLGLVAAITDHHLASRAAQEAARLRAFVVELEAT
jgi:NO-binding membrane sensor protein with MHYT domain